MSKMTDEEIRDYYMNEKILSNKLLSASFKKEHLQEIVKEHFDNAKYEKVCMENIKILENNINTELKHRTYGRYRELIMLPANQDTCDLLEW